MKIETTYNIYDDVYIIPFDNIKGKIVGIWFVEKGMKYLTRYFFECKVREEYFYEQELSFKKK